LGPCTCSSPALDAGDGFEACLDAGEELAHRPAAVGHGRVDGEHRGGLRRAVTFQHPDPEALEPGRAHRLGEPLGPGDHIAQAVEIIGMGEARVVLQEGRGAEEHGAATVIDQLRDHAVVERARVDEDAGPGHQRQERPNRQAEGMEHRKDVEDLVLGPKVDHGPHLGDVGEERAVREHHSLGLGL
jgi:hypothetical protein